MLSHLPSYLYFIPFYLFYQNRMLYLGHFSIGIPINLPHSFTYAGITLVECTL